MMIKLGSVNLTVQNMSASERFYVEELGLKVDTERTNRPSFVLLRAANCMLILQEGTAAGAESVELAFEVDDLEAMQGRLGSRAVVQDMGWGQALEMADPDGVRVTLYRSRPA